MPEYLHPGVYIEEIEPGPRPIEEVPTSTAALLGELSNRDLAAAGVSARRAEVEGEYTGEQYFPTHECVLRNCSG